MPNSPTQAGSIAFWGNPSGSILGAGSINPFDQQRDEQGRIDPNIEDLNLNPWDTATIQGMEVPGIVRIENFKKEMQRQKKKAQGNHGASITLLGFDLAEFTVSIRMWTARQFVAYQQLVHALQTQLLDAMKLPATGTLARQDPNNMFGTVQQSYSPQLAAAAVSIKYPSLAVFGITQAYLRSFIPPLPGGQPGEMVAKILFEEFQVPIQAVPTTIKGGAKNLPKSKFDATAKNTPPDQTDAVLSDLPALPGF